MNTDFLKYDTASISEYLRDKLIDSGVYTDQVYPGSDTKLLIDLFSWTFSVLQYILNNNASDVLFADSTVYENMNRLTKLLSYSPKGYTTSKAEFIIGLSNSNFENFTGGCIIPKYSYIETDKTDSDGNAVRYSFIENYSFNILNGQVVYSDNNPLLYNGEFCKYTCETTATGSDFEVFLLLNLGPNADTPIYIDDSLIDIYIEYTDEYGIQKYENVIRVDSLILDSSADDLHCEVRLNENKEYEIKFGDGIHGKKLSEGTTVHVIYLKSNCEEGKIESNEVNASSLNLKITGFSNSTKMIEMCFGGIDTFKNMFNNVFSKNSSLCFSTSDFTLSNLDSSSNVKDYESVDTIRSYAPDLFRSGNRLVTANDYRTYILNNFSNIIDDVYISNNNEYCTLFYKWLNKYDKLNVNIRLYNYEYSDACDFNNIYIWLKSNNSSTSVLNSEKQLILSKCNKIKSLTTNLIPCDAIRTYFIPFIKYDGFSIEDLTNNVLASYVPPIEIQIKKSRTYLSNDVIKSNIADVILKYFEDNSKLGGNINLYELNKEIMSLGYIESIKTVYSPENSDELDTSYQFINGLSFAAFTDDIIELSDFEVFSSTYYLNKFQYAELLNSENIINLIVITNEDDYSLRNEEI